MNNKKNRAEETKLYFELHDKLKAMKFSGMAEELTRQTEDPNIDLRPFEERFYDLVEAEWQLRYNKKFNRFLKMAHLKITGACFDEDLYKPERKLDIVTIENLSTCDWIREGRNLLVTGANVIIELSPSDFRKEGSYSGFNAGKLSGLTI